ncbi:hypothetical protein LMG28138_05339 [Pararobbsia alpina]|uniref:Uncharacterized protein n=1 Tax=Pararobbsia alpina TaxID=621374 RepID=A0A6S7BYQ9_9BURK|nr:hypothetical protein LMG28138_05339 [Pararobbsia alpina]
MPLKRGVLPDQSEARQECLRAFWITKAAQVALAIARRLVAVLSSVIQSGCRFNKYVLHARQLWTLGLGRRIEHLKALSQGGNTRSVDEDVAVKVALCLAHGEHKCALSWSVSHLMPSSLLLFCSSAPEGVAFDNDPPQRLYLSHSIHARLTQSIASMYARPVVTGTRCLPDVSEFHGKT